MASSWLSKHKTILIYGSLILLFCVLTLWIKFTVDYQCTRSDSIEKITAIYIRIGDLPIHQGQPKDPGQGWGLINSNMAHNYEKAHVAWLKLNLLKSRKPGTWLYFRSSEIHFQVFANNHMIYNCAGANNHSGIITFSAHPMFIRLTPTKPSTVYIRVFPNRFASPNHWDEFFIGSQSELFHRMVGLALEEFVFAIIFIFLGLCLLASLPIGGRNYLPFAGIGLFAFCIGVYNLSLNSISQWIWNSPLLSNRVGVFFYYLAPIGIILFFSSFLPQECIQKSAKRFRQFILYGFAFHGLVMLVLDTVGVMPIYSTFYLFQITFITVTIFCVITGVGLIKNERTDMAIFVFGSLFAALTGIHDILASFLGGPPLGLYTSDWGIFVFISSLIVFMLKRYVQMHREVSALNRTLEERVAKRTEELEHANHDLGEVNEELQATLAHLEETELQLIQSEKVALLGHLVAGIAHEINSPLGSIKANVDMENTLLKSLDPYPADCAELFEQTADMNHVNRLALDRIIGLVKGLKNFVRLDEADLKDADLHEGLESTLLILNNQFKSRIDISKDYGTIPTVLCYPQQINQVFLNIILNAIQAIEGKGKITIKTRYEGESVRISFKDTGPGIPPENLAKIFKKGFTTKGRDVGTGLGLSICQEIIERNRGRIWVESELGQGTEFFVELPSKSSQA